MNVDKEEVNGYDTMLERGEIILNGYHFFVKPITLGEETQYFSECKFLLYPQTKDGNAPNKKDLNRYAISIFLKPPKDSDNALGLLERIKEWYQEHFCHNYKYYSDNPGALNLVKWIERKVTIDEKPVRFYDLERKYNLRKHEIAQLIIYFHDISGFC